MSIDGVQSVITQLTRRSDIALALFLGVLVMMMILPLPTLLVDIIIGFNIAIAISILMLSIYISQPLQFSSFPSVLLLITLFRLALSISTTRLILLEADAGDIIETFGDFVVGGNMIVGFVIFMIITIVQFIVITKGSERVAEVSARFSLDAMPGKQMSIDSDLRAGIITMDEARFKREQLTKESQLFGSMDGAMKFVKGDAIAGIIIIFINLIGGISIGVFQLGMSTSDAADVYSILTIGDGLVSQIPALFVAIASGIIVTRVTGDNSSHLGADISKQFFDQPYAILVTSTMIFLMGFIPGFPTAIFMVIGIVMAGVGWSVYRLKTQGSWLTDGPSSEGAEGSNSTEITTNQKSMIRVSAPILVEISNDLQRAIPPETLNASFRQIRQEIFNEIGVPIPKISFVLSDSLKDRSYAFHIHELPIVLGKVHLNKSFVFSGLEKIQSKNIPMSINTYLGEKGAWIDEKHSSTLVKLDINKLNALQFISWHLKPVIKQHASKFIGIQEVYTLFNKIESDYSELIKEAQKVLPLPKLSEVLRRLVHEGVSIRDLRKILEVLAEKSEAETDPIALTEFVREGIKDHICHQHSSDDNVLSAYIIDPDFEQEMQKGLRKSSSGIFISLDQKLDLALKNQISKYENELSSDKKSRPVIITSSEIRSSLKAHLEKDFGFIPILSHQEISSLVTIRPIAEIKLP